MGRIFIPFCFILCTPFVGLAAQKLVVLSDPASSRSPGISLELFEDKTGTVSFDQARSEFSTEFFPSTDEVPGFGFTSSVYWARFRLRNDTTENRWLLQFAAPLTDDIQIFSVGAEGTVDRRTAGLRFPFDQRELSHRTFLFAYELPPGQEVLFYIRVKNQDVMQFPVTFWTPAAFAAQDHDEQLIHGLFYGIIFVMIVYNLFIFLTVWDRGYAYYVLYTFVTLIFMLSQNGFGYEYLWGDLPAIAGKINTVFVPLAMLSFVLFTRNFLNMSVTAPGLQRWSNLFVWAGVVLMVIAVFAPVNVSGPLNTLFALPALILMLAASFVVYFRGYRLALYYIVAFTLFIFGAVLFGLRAVGVVEVSLLTIYSIQIGQVLEVTLLSIGLGARINLLKAGVESARASSQLKSAFLANVSHEMRTPLNVVLGMGDLLADARLTRDEHKYLDVMRGAGESLLALINDLLDISRVEVGGLSLRRSDFAPRAVVEQCREMLAHQARAKELQLEVHVDAGVPRELHGDPDRLRQVLVNLLGNALKFTEEGAIQLSVQSEPPDKAGKVKLKFRVSDTGIGIPADKLELIFESFRQVDDFETRRQEGAGLGLSISRELVRLMEGEIGVKSEHGRGSVFHFTAYFTPAAIQPGDTPDQKIDTNIVSRSLDILLVDDNQDNRMLFQAFLKKSAHRIEIATDGTEAVAKFKERRYDIVFMDIQMPELDGLSATRQIRAWEVEQIKRGARQARVPIHALSAHALAEEVDKSLAAGCDGHIAKPVRREEILETLAEV